MAIDEVLDSKRHRKKYRDHELYLTLADKAGKLHALQTSVSDRNINRDAHTLSNIEALSRFTSLVIRAYSAEFAIKELEGCALGPHTLPAILASVVKEHIQGSP
jgi:acetolactate synthase small subunit